MPSTTPKTYAVIVAGGVGARMGAKIPKQYLKIGGRPILARTLDVFEQTEVIDAVVIVVPRGHVASTKNEIVRRYGFRKVKTVCVGGDRRQHSVRNGILAIKEPCDVVAVHDGVRPFVTPEIIARSVHVARHFGAALVAEPVNATIKVIADDGFVIQTPERRKLMAAQTPQTFQYNLIRMAFDNAEGIDFRPTDDCQMVERLGYPVVIVQGDRDNIKITNPIDLELAELIWKRRRAPKGRKR